MPVFKCIPDRPWGPGAATSEFNRGKLRPFLVGEVGAPGRGDYAQRAYRFASLPMMGRLYSSPCHALYAARTHARISAICNAFERRPSRKLNTKMIPVTALRTMAAIVRSRHW